MDVKQLQDQTSTDFQPNVPDKVGYPDFSAETTKTWGSTLTASDDGWLKIEGGCKPSVYVEIDGKRVGYWNNSAASSVTIETMFPIKKGQTFMASGGYDYQHLYFYPLLTNTNGGGCELISLTTSLVGVVA